MIVYDLHCKAGHQFEGWFKQANDYTQQLAGGLLSCPVCGSSQISKLPSASHVHTRSLRGTQQPQASHATEHAETRHVLQQWRDYVDQHFTDVGDRFPEEARKIHYGETQAHNIRGTASDTEVKALVEEGVEVHPLPPIPVDKQKLN